MCLSVLIRRPVVEAPELHRDFNTFPTPSCGSRDCRIRVSSLTIENRRLESADVVLMPADPFDSYKLENLLDNA